jgi:hypothetical protein
VRELGDGLSHRATRLLEAGQVDRELVPVGGIGASQGSPS